jgi:hypothetical protein
MVEVTDTLPNLGPTIRARRITWEGGFHEGLATSAYFRRVLMGHISSHSY